jgi:transmembrane sensor
METKEIDYQNQVYHFISGTLKSRERKDLLEWAKASEENKNLFLTYYYNGEDKMKQQLHFDKEQAWQQLMKEIDGSSQLKRRRRIIYYTSTVAACAVIVIASVLYKQYFKSPDILKFAQMTSSVKGNPDDVKLVLSKNKTLFFQSKSPAIKYGNQSISIDNQTVSEASSSAFNQLIVPYGKRSSLTLVDGTKVWVNAGSKLIYPTAFSKKQREVYVEGEVYLEVKHNNNWPFIVRTKNLNVNVLGTKFDVSTYSSVGESDVVLVSGLVHVERGNSVTALKPNNIYSLKGNRALVYQVNVQQYISWIDGVYTFDSESLNNIFSRLEKYYNTKVMCDASVGSLRCTGKLDLSQSFDKLLEGLSKTAPIIYREEDGRYIVHIKK